MAPNVMKLAAKGTSVFSHINSAKDGKCTCCNTTLVLVAYLLFNLISILEIVFGALFFDQCDLEPMIPIYLIGAGSGCIVTFLFRVLCQLCWKPKKLPKCVGYIFIILSFLNLGWFFAGNYYVFHIWQPNHNEDLGKFCNEELYMFAFTMMLIYYSFGLLLICIPCCIIYCAMLHITNAKISNAGGCLGEDKTEQTGHIAPAKCQADLPGANPYGTGKSPSVDSSDLEMGSNGNGAPEPDDEAKPEIDTRATTAKSRPNTSGFTSDREKIIMSPIL